MESRRRKIQQWLRAQTEHEATEAVIALAMEEVTTARRTDRDRYEEDNDEMGEKR